jgi:hypothetical protein
MTYHTRLNVGHMDFGHAGQRTDRIKAALAEERKVLQASPKDSYNATVATYNIEDLEMALERAEVSDQARAERQRERQAAKEANLREAQARDEAALRDRIRSDFMSQPGATEGDFERLFPQLRDQYLMEQSGKVMTEAQRRIGSVL